MRNLIILFLLAFGLSEIFAQAKPYPHNASFLGYVQITDSLSIGDSLYVATLKDTTTHAGTYYAVYVDSASGKMYAQLVSTPDLSNYIKATGGQNVMGQKFTFNDSVFVSGGKNITISKNDTLIFPSNFTPIGGKIVNNEFYGGIRILDENNINVVQFNKNGQIQLYGTEGGCTSISSEKTKSVISSANGASINLESNGGILIQLNSGDSLKIHSLRTATTPNTLYYNTTTKEVSYGAAPVTDTTSIYAALDSKADTGSIADLSTRIANDSIAKNTALATKWTQGGDSVGTGIGDIGAKDNRSVNMISNNKRYLRLDSLTQGYIELQGDGTTSPRMTFVHITGDKLNYIESASGGTGRLFLNSGITIEFAQGGTSRFRICSGSFTPTTIGTYDLGSTTFPFRNTISNSFTSLAGASRTWGVEASASGAGVNWTLRGSGAASGATDGNGGMVTVAYGKSTGTGFGSFRITRYSRAISTGTADNTESDAMIIPSSKLMADETSTDLFNVAVATGISFGLTVEYTIKTVGGAGNESHTEVGTMYIMASNDGAVTVTVTKTTSAQHKSDAGTYTATFAATTANPSVISVTADTDLNVNSVIHYNIINKDEQVINQL